MSKPSLAKCILVVSSDPSEASSLQAENPDAKITWVRSLADLQDQLARESPDGIVLGGKTILLKDVAALCPGIDLAATALLAGPFRPSEGAIKLGTVLGNGNRGTSEPSPASRALTLEDYVESKMGEFVRAMKVSAARDLYPTVMRAVERPLIKLALKETNGNQIRASRLLGMNRNTLRKKISEFDISVKKHSRRTHLSESEGRKGDD